MKTKVVIDTNVFISGIFFNGPPARILHAWQEDQFQLAISEEIVAEYRRVLDIFAIKFKHIDFKPVIEMLFIKAELVGSYSFKEQISEDPDDDKFIACAIASESKFIVSGDRHLLKIGKYLNTTIITPRYFVDHLL